MPTRGVSLLWAETHVGKTTVGVDIANAVAYRSAWQDRFAIPANGSVFYVATEGDVSKQIVGVTREKPANCLRPFELFLLEDAPQISLDGKFLRHLENVFERGFANAEEAAEEYKEERRLQLIAKFGETPATEASEWALRRDFWENEGTRLVELYDCCADKPKLIVIDNLTNTFPGKENDNDDQTDYRNALRAIGRRFNAHVMVLHNPVKGGKDIRGGQSLEDGMDAVYHLKEQRDGSLSFVTTKLRDHECPPPIQMRIQKVKWPLAGQARVAAHAIGESEFSTAAIVLPVESNMADVAEPLLGGGSNARHVDYEAIDTALRALLASDPTLSRNKIELKVAAAIGVSKSTIKVRLDIVAPDRVWPKRQGAAADAIAA